jgi:hypothetical protein
MAVDTNTRISVRPVVMLDNWVSDIPYVNNKTEYTHKAEASKPSVLEFQHAKYWLDTRQQYTILNQFWFWC